MHGKKVVCYVATWAVYRKQHGQFNLEDLDPSLCTHLIYSFAGLDENKNSIKTGFKRLVALKERYPHLKVTIAIGGWNEGSPKYSKMASEPESREAFVKSVLELKEAFEPFNYILTAALGAGQSTMESAYELAKLSRHLDLIHMMAYDYHGTWDGLVGANAPLRGTGDSDVLHVVSGHQSTMESAYELAKLSRHLDLIHMMAYDYHGSWDGLIGANAPLRGTGGSVVLHVVSGHLSTMESAYELAKLSRHLDMIHMMAYDYHGTWDGLVSANAPLRGTGDRVSPYKLVLGLPFYGRTFVLSDPDSRRVEFGRTPVKTKGFKGPYTGEDGFMGYNEICSEISNKSSPWTHYWDERSATPYLRDGERVISYDNARSIAIKVKMAVDRGLGGLMVWSIDTDDFRGLCAEEPEPYRDFIERYNKIVDQPLLQEALKTLNLPDGELTLRLPVRKPGSNYNLLRSINEATSLAIQEKRILDEMSRVTRENEIQDDDDGGSASGVVSSFVTVLMCLLVVNICKMV
ncbi:Chitinase, partial [Operophtera brumata]